MVGRGGCRALEGGWRRGGERGRARLWGDGRFLRPSGISLEKVLLGGGAYVSDRRRCGYDRSGWCRMTVVG